jgi:hypothetical protein
MAITLVHWWRQLKQAWNEIRQRQRLQNISEKWDDLRRLEREERQLKPLAAAADQDDFHLRRQLQRCQAAIRKLRTDLHIDSEEEQQIAEFQAERGDTSMPTWLLKRNGVLAS